MIRIRRLQAQHFALLLTHRDQQCVSLANASIPKMTIQGHYHLINLIKVLKRKILCLYLYFLKNKWAVFYQPFQTWQTANNGGSDKVRSKLCLHFLDVLPNLKHEQKLLVYAFVFVVIKLTLLEGLQLSACA